MSSTPRRTAENASVMASSTRPFRCNTTSAASAPASASPGAVRRCNEIVRSVRSETLFTNVSFCRSEPTTRLSSSCFSMMASARRCNGMALTTSPISVYSRAMLPTAISVPWL